MNRNPPALGIDVHALTDLGEDGPELLSTLPIQPYRAVAHNAIAIIRQLKELHFGQEVYIHVQVADPEVKQAVDVWLAREHICQRLDIPESHVVYMTPHEAGGAGLGFFRKNFVYAHRTRTLEITHYIGTHLMDESGHPDRRGLAMLRMMVALPASTSADTLAVRFLLLNKGISRGDLFATLAASLGIAHSYNEVAQIIWQDITQQKHMHVADHTREPAQVVNIASARAANQKG